MRRKKPFALVLHYTQNTIILCPPNILCIGRTAYLLSFMNIAYTVWSLFILGQTPTDKESGIQYAWNMESTSWNSESKTLLDYLN